MKKIFFTTAATLLLLAGCEQEAFTEECRAFQKAKQMRQWEFKPSPKDDY